MCIYIYMQIFPTLSYILFYIFICLQIGSYILFLHLLLHAPICFAILSHIVLYIFPYVLIFLLYIPRDFPICSNRFQYFWVQGTRHNNSYWNSLRSFFFSPIGGAAIAWAQECPGSVFPWPGRMLGDHGAEARLRSASKELRRRGCILIWSNDRGGAPALQHCAGAHKMDGLVVTSSRKR